MTLSRLTHKVICASGYDADQVIVGHAISMLGVVGKGWNASNEMLQAPCEMLQIHVPSSLPQPLVNDNDMCPFSTVSLGNNQPPSPSPRTENYRENKATAWKFISIKYTYILGA